MRDHVVVMCMAVAACGRVGFDPPSDADVVPPAHDEDGDGVADTSDVCPHLAGSQADSDGDGVGDDCDPNPTVAGDRIALFATMRPGDQPLTPFGEGTWEQHGDAFALVGGPDPTDNRYFGGVGMTMSVRNVRVAIGFDIVNRFDGTPQNQFALGIISDPPYEYVELNEAAPTSAFASITTFDGTNFIVVDPQPLSGGIHRGSVFFQGTFVVGTSTRFDVGWPGETYVSRVMDAVYQGGDYLQININNLNVEIRYLVVISSP